jgi:hypothetical protein
MPQIFTYWNPIKEPPRFQCTLIPSRCTHIQHNGKMCPRIQIIGADLCTHHLTTDKRLEIKTSTLPHGGLGLFAHDNHQQEGDIVFTYSRTRRRGDFITDYVGETLSLEETTDRYGQNNTVPYGVRLNSKSNIDAACLRGVGAHANHQARRHTNARFILDGKRVYIEATRNIRNGEEIFINYGREYNIRQEGISYSHDTQSA